MSAPADRPPNARLQAALQQLEASRSALRVALIPPPEPALPEGQQPGLADPLRRLWRRWRRLSRHAPAARLLRQATQAWWQRHPWRPTGVLLLRQVQPLVREHPVSCTAAAAALGAALVSLRPWRWRAVEAHWRPLPGQLTRWALAQLRSAPVQLALASLLWLPPDPDDPPEAPASDPPGAPASTPPATHDETATAEAGPG